MEEDRSGPHHGLGRAHIVKGDAEAKLAKVEQDLADVHFKLKAAEGKIAAAKVMAK